MSEVKVELNRTNSEVLAKRMMFLAYEAAGGPCGMGILQAREGATEEDVWNNVSTAGDYPGPGNNRIDGSEITVLADYVFGRMVKLMIKYGPGYIKYHDQPLSLDYEAWCLTYPKTEDLVSAALLSLAATTVE